MDTQKTDKPVRLTRREMLKLSGALAAGSLLAACGPSATPEATTAPSTTAPEVTEAPVTVPTAAPVTGNVVMMHHIQQGEMSEDLVTQFETQYPGITIELVQTDLTRFFAMYAAGNPPDLVRVQAPSVPPYLARGMLYDLTPYFEASSVLRPDDLAPANNYYKAEDPLHVGSGRLYGMCKDWSPDFTLYAYKTAFADKGISLPSETEPLTYQQAYDLGAQLATFDGDRVTMFGFDYPDVWVDRMWMNILGEVGSLLYADDYTQIVLAGNETAQEVLQYFYNHAKDRLGAVGAINPSPNWIGDDFDKGLVGLLMYGYWFSAMAETDVTTGQVLFIPGPTWTGVRRDPTMTATGMVMSALSQVPDAAWKVFEWYNGGQPSLDRAGSGWGVPALISQYALMPNTTPFQNQVQAVLQGELALNTPPLQFNPYLGETTVANAWLQYLQQAVAGDISFDQMLTNIEFDVNTAIQDGIAAIG
jgi:multiple sugar transport system substrate-binding protein